MKVITTGYKYELSSFEDGPAQTLQFIEKERITKEPGSDAVVDKLVTINDGTTNEEVLRVLIDRLNYLQGKCSCRENAIVITKLEEALLWLNYRTTQRQSRGVEGKPIS